MLGGSRMRLSPVLGRNRNSCDDACSPVATGWRGRACREPITAGAAEPPLGQADPLRFASPRWLGGPRPGQPTVEFRGDVRGEVCGRGASAVVPGVVNVLGHARLVVVRPPAVDVSRLPRTGKGATAAPAPVARVLLAGPHARGGAQLPGAPPELLRCGAGARPVLASGREVRSRGGPVTLVHGYGPLAAPPAHWSGSSCTNGTAISASVEPVGVRMV